MFTGIIREVGTVVRSAKTGEGLALAVSASDLSKSLSPGASVAVNGVCQTVETVTGETFTFTAVGETLKRTTLGVLRPRDSVNLEAAATLETALGGHLVQGHVDGVGRVVAFSRVAEDRLLTLELPGDLHTYVIEKGSIAVDGVSLTIVSVEPANRITITIVPFTMQKTTVAHYRPESKVNIEIDILGKYVRQYLMNGYGQASIWGGRP